MRLGLVESTLLDELYHGLATRKLLDGTCEVLVGILSACGDACHDWQGEVEVGPVKRTDNRQGRQRKIENQQMTTRFEDA